MKKQIVVTEQAEACIAAMDRVSFKKFIAAKTILLETGFLYYPLAEKVDGQKDLFAMRIMTRTNERLFYCYEKDDTVFILCGYQKKTKKIPKAELKHALAIKKGIGL